VRFESLQVAVGSGPAFLVTGRSARVVYELAAMGGSARWPVVAGEIWPGSEPDLLRAKWDKALAALRDRLREGGVRHDLVQTRRGIVELMLGPGDRVEVEE